MMQMYSLPQPKVSLWTLFKSLTPAERKATFKVMMLPYTTRKHNVLMWLHIVAFTAIELFVLYMVESVIFEKGWSGGWRAFTGGWIGYMLLSDTFRHCIRTLNNGIEARIQEQTQKAMQQVSDMVNNYGIDLKAKIKEASGRQELADDPISMSAASLDAIDKAVERHDSSEQNPLKAALEGDMDALGQSLADDDADEDGNGRWI